jgi:hypothetical protein
MSRCPAGSPDLAHARSGRTAPVGAFLLSFGVIFVAELGDKSQLMAMTFATRYRFWTVLGGITAATALVHLASVALGTVVGVNLPTSLIRIVAGIAFLVFGAWTCVGTSSARTNRPRQGAPRARRSLPWRSPSSSPNLATRRCSQLSRWQRRRAGSEPGLAPRSGWSRPTPWGSPSAPCWAASCQRRPYALERPSCSSLSALG